MHPAVGGSQPSVDTADTAHSSGHACTGHAPATQPSQGATTRTLATHSEWRFINAYDCWQWKKITENLQKITVYSPFSQIGLFVVLFLCPAPRVSLRARVMQHKIQSQTFSINAVTECRQLRVKKNIIIKSVNGFNSHGFFCNNPSPNHGEEARKPVLPLLQK